jgi:hypothetical protein
VLAESKAVSVVAFEGDEILRSEVGLVAVRTRNEATWLETMNDQNKRRRTFLPFTMSLYATDGSWLVR